MSIISNLDTLKLKDSSGYEYSLSLKNINESIVHINNNKQNTPIVETIPATSNINLSLSDNVETIIEGVVTTVYITSAAGCGVITFTAGSSVVFHLPDGSGWSGYTPVFEEGKIYNVVYYKGSFYADGGR